MKILEKYGFLGNLIVCLQFLVSLLLPAELFRRPKAGLPTSKKYGPRVNTKVKVSYLFLCHMISAFWDEKNRERMRVQMIFLRN